MKPFLFPFFLMIGFMAYCQEQSPAILEENLRNLGDEGYRGMVITYDNRYTGVKGSPFFNEAWLPGKLYLSSGDSIAAQELKLDIYQHELVVHRKNVENYVKKEAVDGFELNDNGSNYVFVKARHPRKEGYYFFQQLTKGKASLFLFHEVEFNKADYKGAYASGTSYDEFILSREYYASVGTSELEKVKPRKNQVIKFFPDKNAEIEAFIEENNPDLSNLQDLTKVFDYYNGL